MLKMLKISHKFEILVIRATYGSKIYSKFCSLLLIEVLWYGIKDILITWCQKSNNCVWNIENLTKIWNFVDLGNIEFQDKP